MRYSRLRKRNTRKKYALLLLVALIGLSMIYIFSAGTLGKLLSKLILPVLDLDNLGNKNTSQNSDIGNSITTLPDEINEVENNKTDHEKITENLKVNPLSLYTIQMGAFTDEENAKEFSNNLKSKGGAGYIHFDGFYRVLAVGFQSEEDAKKVKDNLKSDSIESNIYKLSSNGAEMQITAVKENVEFIRSAYEAWEEKYSSLEQMMVSLDTNSNNVSEVTNKIKEIKEEMEMIKNRLEEIRADKSDNIILTGLLELYRNSCMSLDKIINVESINKVAISSEIKYTYIDLFMSYKNYMEQIT